MPKDSTNFIQNYIYELGNKLGFISHKEHSFMDSFSDSYTPSYDVVWLMDITKDIKTELIKKYINSETWHPHLDRVVIATFEIEGSATTSKNQIGNFANLYLSPSYYKFVIVNNAGAKNEYDTYRRGVKISRTFEEFWGKNNFIFLDWEHVKHFEYKSDISSCAKNTRVSNQGEIIRSKTGGESKSVPAYNELVADVQNSGLQLKQNYEPEFIKYQYERIEMYRQITCSNEYDVLLGNKFVYNPTTNEERNINKIGDYFYIPKIDVALGFYLPHSLLSFFEWISNSIGNEVVNNCFLNFIKEHNPNELFFPYLGCEIESSLSKHLNGGIMNCSRFFYTGLIIAPEAARKHVKTLKRRLGINNLFFHPYNF